MNSPSTPSSISPELIEKYATVSVATAHEAMGRIGALDSAIKPIRFGMKTLGIALTCRCHPGDNLAMHAALKAAQPGNVIVCDAGGYTEIGSFGDIMAGNAMARGITGLVIDGSVRDSEMIHKIGFPTFSRGVSVKGAAKETFGSLREPVSVGGIIVHTGDLIIGDDDGVVAIPADQIATLYQACQAREDAEQRFREELLKGKTTWDVMNLQEIADRQNINVKF